MAKKVLLIDDDEDVLKLLQIKIKSKGYEVVVGKDGNAALQLAKSEKPAIMLIDYNLPGKNGAEVAKELKGTGIPILLLSGSEQNVEEGLVQGSFTKPYNFDQIFAAMEKLTAQG